jgi:hypothetical protein
MRALTLWQPWASAVALGAKRLETRSWPTHYRGTIAIHAAAVGDRGRRELGVNNPVWRHLRAMGCSTRFDELPFGAVVAVAEVVDCIPIGPPGMDPDRLSDRERDCGDYRAGRWAWALEVITALARPVECAGARGLWIVKDDLAARIRAAAWPTTTAPALDDLHSRIAP